MSHGAEEASLRHQLVFLRRWWLVPVLLGVVGAVAAAVLTSRQAPLYQATALIEVVPPTGEQAGTNASPRVPPIVATEVERMRSPDVGAAVGDDPARPPHVVIEAQPDSYVLSIRARSNSPVDAATAANDFATRYVQWRQDQAAGEPTPSSGGRVPGAVALLNPAQEPIDPVSPGPARNGVLGMGGGLLLGLVLASLLDRVDDRLRRWEDLEATVNLPVVGVLPREPLRHLQGGPLTFLAPGSPSAEAYGRLRANIELLADERPMRCLQVTGAVAGEGTTTVATALAVSLARVGHRVILLDGDLRHPKVHAAFGLGNETGLAQVLLGQRSLAEAIVPVDGAPSLAVLPAGPLPADPSELLASDRFRAVVATLRVNCDVLVLDGQPVLAGPDCLIISRHANAVLLVARPRQSTRRQVRQAHRLLDQVGAPVVGTVLNGAARAAGDHRAKRRPQLSLAADAVPPRPATADRNEVPS